MSIELRGFLMLNHQSKTRPYQGLCMDIKTNVGILERISTSTVKNQGLSYLPGCEALILFPQNSKNKGLVSEMIGSTAVTGAVEQANKS